MLVAPSFRAPHERRLSRSIDRGLRVKLTYGGLQRGLYTDGTCFSELFGRLARALTKAIAGEGCNAIIRVVFIGPSSAIG